MGNMCTAEQKEQFEAKAEDVVEQAKEVVEDVKEKVEEAVEQAKEIAEDVKEKVEETVEQAKEATAGATEAVADAAADGQEKAQEVAAEAVAQVKEVAAGVAEAVADTMTAATAAVTGTMIIEFDDGKGSSKTVDFKAKELGFAVTRSGGGCCVSAAAARVVVGKVDKKQQADKLGVKRGWAIKAVNGSEVTGLEAATKLLEEGKARLA